MVIRQKLTQIDPWLTPHADALQERVNYTTQLKKRLLGTTSSLKDFAVGYDYFGLHQTQNGWILREWAPQAIAVFLVCEQTNWQDVDAYKAVATTNGQWELSLPREALRHGDAYKLHIYWQGGDGYRLPSYVTYVVQDSVTHDFVASVWQPPQAFVWSDTDVTPTVDPLLIYEAHVGMSSDKPEVASYRYFADNIIPRIQSGGYNAIQLMAVQEHPYYGSFGYHVSNFFAASSRFGTPDDLKYLVDTAHRHGLVIILDVVHSHAVKNEHEGLSRFDGSLTQYFHDGPRGNHEQWDSRTFDYGKPEVLHFLLSNCRYWLDEYHFDGFRFDGVTSMLYTHHGMGKAFMSYDDYFADTDNDAVTYLTLANELIHEIKPSAITIAEDMSGMPGVAGSITNGGMGFDYRLNMGVPDLWIKYIKEKRDEDWRVSELFHELTSHRPEERTINYAESHDQALVGDKTIMFRLADKDMYDHMLRDDTSLVIERAIALHKLIRLLTATTNSGGYLTFMGNEFGHPEWIDFPRHGNDWSYAHARRQWQLADDANLKYQWLGAFDRELTKILPNLTESISDTVTHDSDHVVAFARGEYVIAVNLHPSQSYANYGVSVPNGIYEIILSSDDLIFGGQARIDTRQEYESSDGQLRLYIPVRTGVVLRQK
ncbi:MAG: alpha-amylase family glycosyl hydrolase [Candidatus Saccharimonadales bacterium]